MEGIKMIKNYTGIKFESLSCIDNEVLQRYNDKYYLIKEVNIITGKSRSDILLTPEQIQEYLDNQEEIIEKNKKAMEYHIKTEEQTELEKQKELQEQAEYENVYGYLNNKTPIQKGRILKILNVKISYAKDGEFLGYLTRKDFLYRMINEGCFIAHKKDINYYGKDGELRVKPNEYRLVDSDGSFYEITKTEYDYANYLIKNIINIE